MLVADGEDHRWWTVERIDATDRDVETVTAVTQSSNSGCSGKEQRCIELPTGDISQNSQFFMYPLPPTNPNMCCRPSLFNVEPPNNEVESPTGLENIQLDEGEENSRRDSHLIMAQSVKGFNYRIKEVYNNNEEHGEFKQRKVTQLKSRWNRIHPPIQKFNDCYRQSVYSSSSNPGTPIEVEEYGTTSTMSRSIGQKATKRKSKGKRDENTSNNLNLSSIESAMKDKYANIAKLIELKEAQERHLQEHERCLEYEILMKDTSDMSEKQLQDHKKYCDYIRQKQGF
ncbi:hypothetical protein JHK82_019608 [Glycine max]|uniref:No apical meristem-associated C-terminal domain-containing protein n=2 Tax=Glycine subgen. Soja TaxID=1462606 RepID=A0A0R0J739_SOYBN|nr:hypothetical protein JHK85_020049 [Glycine max]KAG5038785.1 hypothetical protein JHK86_019625 [Glycine max]KAG5143913.1 hypothetical protein JHK82_019608 [Glycine max]KAH1088225.1 hypothetical protein GYH30_019327 [Glycine max]RZC04275.1 hypothetical protein D0Y65_018744 [Glycine soja]